jgi:hypothetical protein
MEESYRFLRQREPKGSILGSFDMTVIGRPFPDYEREIGKQILCRLVKPVES